MKLNIYYNQQLEQTSNHKTFETARAAMDKVKNKDGRLAVILADSTTVRYRGMAIGGWKFEAQTYGPVKI